MSQSCMGFKFQRWRTIKIMQLAIIIAFEWQLEPPPNPLKKIDFHLKFTLTNCQNPLVNSPPPPPFFRLQLLVIVFFRSTNILGISSMIRVLSTLHISKMGLKRKKSYKPKGAERKGEGHDRVPIHMYLYEQVLHALAAWTWWSHTGAQVNIGA